MEINKVDYTDDNENIQANYYKLHDASSNNDHHNKTANKNSPLKSFDNLNSIGQLLAILGVGSKLIVNNLQNTYSLVTPLTFNMFYYLFLFIFNICILRYLKLPKISYIIIAIFDSQAIFLNIFAFSKLNFDYPFILNIATVIWTIIITWLFIGAYRYKMSHLFSTFVAICAIGIIFFGIFGVNFDFADNYEGLIYCLASSVCLSISTVLQEVIFKSGQDIYEFLPWLGILGLIISTIEAYLMGHLETFFNFELTFDIFALVIGYAIIMVIFMEITPFYISRVKAAMYNISLVSQIFYSYIIEVIFYQESNHKWTYYIGFLLLLISIIWFNTYPVEVIKENNETSNSTDDDASSQFTEKKEKEPYKDINERSGSFYRNRNQSQSLSKKALTYLFPS